MYHCLLSEQERQSGIRRPFIAANTGLRNATVLECSPRFNEKRRAIYREVFGRYVASDFDLSAHRADLKIDLTREESVAGHLEAFDIILCSGVLEHVPDYLTALKNLRRMLKPGGYVVFQVPVLEKSYTRVTWDEFHDDNTRVFHRFGFDILAALDETFASATPVAGMLDFEITSPEISRDKYSFLKAIPDRCQIIGAETMVASGLGSPDLCDAFILRT
jgi:SAM-dependent methyltransferase